MKIKTFRLILGLLILLVSLVFLVWGLLPAEVASNTIQILPEDMQLPGETGWLVMGALL